MKRILVVWVLLCSAALAADVATPTFSQAAGTYVNSVFVYMQSATSGALYCYTTDGTTPTASTPGTCDSSSSIYYAALQDVATIAISSTSTLKVIATKSGMTNSAVASAAYTITSAPATNPVTAGTPVKVTSAAANIVDSEPHLLKASNGDVFLFYSEGVGGNPDGPVPQRLMFKKKASGSSIWTSPTSVACTESDPSTGCFLNAADPADVNIASGGGISYNGTLILMVAVWKSTDESAVGLKVVRSTNNGATWEAPFYLTASYTYDKYVNPTANLISIPPSSAGVTGPCSAGCLIQPVVSSGVQLYRTALVSSYDDGVTWTDEKLIPIVFPYAVEERGMVWAGGMNLVALTRPSWSFQSNGGWPTPLMSLYTSDLGTSWTGLPSDLPVGPCSSNPGITWRDEWTKPSLVTDPNNASLVTLLYGERYQCGSTVRPRYRIVTFTAANAFAGHGQNLPEPQILDLNPSIYTQTGATNHTTYSSMVPLSTNTLLMAWEQADYADREDIYTAVLTYDGVPGTNPVHISGKLSGRVGQ